MTTGESGSSSAASLASAAASSNRPTQPRGQPNLTEEALSAEGLGEARLEHLEGDYPVVAEIVGAVHHRHAPVAHFPIDGIAGLEGGLQPVQEVEQAGSVSPPGGQARYARIAAAITAGTLVQLARSSSAVIRGISRCALRWLIAYPGLGIAVTG